MKRLFPVLVFTLLSLAAVAQSVPKQVPPLMADVRVPKEFLASPVPPQGFILQFFNGSSNLGTATSYAALKCSTGMSCSFSGSTFTMTATGGGSGTVGSCAAAGLGYYSGSGTTIGCDTGITDSSSVLTAAGFNVGTLSFSDTNILYSGQASANSFVQMILQNTNSGASASTDYIVNNDQGTATTHYGDFGINSSGFSGTGNLTGLAGEIYLYGQSGDLGLGTLGANAIHFVANNSAADAATVTSSNVWNFPAAGFSITSATTAGHYLRNNGTNFVDAAISAGDLPSTLTSGTAITNAVLTTPNLGTPSAATLTNASGLPAAGVVAGALANGMTATKQSALSNDTKVATDSYVDSAVAAIGCQSGCSYMIGGENWGFVGPGPGAAYTANQYHIGRFYNTNQRLLGATGCINVTTLHAGGHVDVGVYSISGTTLTLRWHIGQQSTGATGSVCGTSLTTFTMLANTSYYLASCSDDTTALIDIIGSAPIGNQLGGSSATANTYGKDTTDACVNGTLQTTITSTNITNATTVNIPFVLVLN
jgi:hypothetical protein